MDPARRARSSSCSAPRPACSNPSTAWVDERLRGQVGEAVGALVLLAVGLSLFAIVQGRSSRRESTARHQAESRFRALVEQMPAVIYTWDPGRPAGTTASPYVSPQIEQILGFTSQEWTEDPALWIRRVHDEDRERVLAASDAGRPHRRPARDRVPPRPQGRHRHLGARGGGHDRTRPPGPSDAGAGRHVRRHRTQARRTGPRPDRGALPDAGRTRPRGHLHLGRGAPQRRGARAVHQPAGPGAARLLGRRVRGSPALGDPRPPRRPASASSPSGRRARTATRPSAPSTGCGRATDARCGSATRRSPSDATTRATRCSRA